MSEKKILDREKLLRDSFTIAEKFVFATILICATTSFWIAAPDTNWLRGGMIIAGLISVFILKAHQLTHPFFVDLLWSRFWLLFTPIAALILIYLIGLAQNPIQTIEVESGTWLALQKNHRWLPLTSNRDINTWMQLFGYTGMYLVALLLFLVPKSRAFFERLLPWLCFSASILAIFAYAQTAFDLESPLLTKGTGQADFFGLFPYDGHWAAFAVLWASVCISMSIWTSLNVDDISYLNSKGPWYLAAASLFGLSGFGVDARWPAVCLLAAYAALLLLLSLHFLRSSQDKDRKLIATGTGLGGIAVSIGAIFRALQHDSFSETAAHLRSTAYALFKEQPLFGWGLDGYATVLPYYADGTLLLERYERAQSDTLQYLTEFGIVGFGMLAALIAGLVIRYIKGRHGSHLTNYLLIGCGAILTLACVDTPFLSPAVFISFWIVFFSALRWADLSRNPVDHVDARVMVVSDENERKVPRVFETE